jgi:hypothetical protein
MTQVILSIGGVEVYKTPTSSSVSNDTIKYVRVENPTIGNKYYYLKSEKDKHNKPLYEFSKLERKGIESEWPQGSHTIYIFEDGHQDDEVFEAEEIEKGSGGGNPEEENYESREKKEYLPERNFEYN